MAERVLTQRELNRALLARQLLLERARLPVSRALERVAGLQTQYAPSGDVGLWTRLEDFRRDDLTRALERRSVVQATLMRVTIHLVSARDYWLFAAAVRRAQRRGHVEDAKASARLRAALADGPKSVRELGDLAKGFVGNVGRWVELVRVPPSGTWERRRADVLGLAEDWVGPCEVTEDDGLDHLVRRYLGGFGPAAPADIASWAGVPPAMLKPTLARLQLRRFYDEAGKELLDLPRAPLPDPETPAPVRFLAHWDASLLAHARRTGILPEPYRKRMFHTKNPFSVGAVLVDGRVAGAWSQRGGRIVVEQYERLPREVEEERERLEAFHA
jgi:hypothetical protein